MKSFEIFGNVCVDVFEVRAVVTIAGDPFKHLVYLSSGNSFELEASVGQALINRLLGDPYPVSELPPTEPPTEPLQSAPEPFFTEPSTTIADGIVKPKYKTNQRPEF